MVGKMDYSSVPTTVDLENNSSNKKYTVNRSSSGKVVIPKPVCVLMAIGAVLLAVIAGLIVFFLLPRCSKATSQALTKIPNHYEIEQRLPTNLQPIHYRIHFTPRFENNTTSGVVSIVLRTKEETSNIILNVKDMLIDQHSVSVRAVNDSKPYVVMSQEYLPSEQYRISVKETFKKDMDYIVDINFAGVFDDHMRGVYKSERYDDYDRVNKTVISTQFSPTDARRAFPCFDEPSFKAKFSLSIARPKNMSSISNMPRNGEPTIHKNKEGWLWDHYQETPIIPTYVVAFVISDLEPLKTSRPSFMIWSNKLTLQQTSFASQLGPKLIDFYADYLNVDFPVRKVDLVAVPDFGYNAMENWGLIIFRESALLFQTNVSTTEDQNNIAQVLAHELAHQWFGNLITPKWWNDLWLKEGFSTYFQYLGVDHVEPTWRFMEEFLPNEIATAFEKDNLRSSVALSRNVKNNHEIRQAFNEISYSKGACVIRMMNHFLGDGTFKRGLKNLLSTYKYGNVDKTDLFDTLNEQAVKDGILEENMTVGEIMDSWTNKPGFPVVSASMDYEKHVLTISQKRFLLDGHTDDTLWWIPISFTTDSDVNYNTLPKLWLKQENSTTITLNMTKWYYLNIFQTGYYIVNYDERNWRMLIEHIMSLPPLTRAQLISDSMDLARANLLDYDIPFRLISHMALRDDQIMFIPTMTAFKKLTFISDMLVNTPAFGMFEKFHNVIFEATYKNVEFEGSDINNYLSQRILKTVLEWSCRSSYSKCSIMALNYFRDWMGQKIRIQPNLRSIIYCTAIREGTEIEWDFAYDQYLRSSSPTEKNLLLDALGCTNQQWLLSRYLYYLVNNHTSMRIQDADRIFTTIANNKVGNQIAFDFLRKHWRELRQQMGDGFNMFNKLILSLPKYMNTEFQLSELYRFKDELGEHLASSESAIDSTIEIVKSKVKWMKQNYESVEKWLTQNSDHFSYL